MRLNNIPSRRGGRKARLRVGRGVGSGKGKTSGRGQKGQKSRSGSSMRPGFESGHVPLYRRLPRRGFNNARFRVEYAQVNVGRLSKVNCEQQVDLGVLIDAGLVRKNAQKVKILGGGNVERALRIVAHRFSRRAVEKIEAAGGQAIVAGADIARSAPEDSPEHSDG